MRYPHLAYGTPRKLPKAKDLAGRVVVLDIAFAAEGTGTSFDKVTRPLIDGLGPRLAAWVDHHDHELHAQFASDPRFTLATKAEHGACPEMVTPEVVARAGPVDTVLCHVDFDGLMSAAKWILDGREPYEGADADARAIDTRIGTPSPRASQIDRALRARPRDDALKGIVVRHMCEGLRDAGLQAEIDEAARVLRVQEDESRQLARGYERHGDAVFVDASERKGTYDKTLLLLLGQERARIAVVLDESGVTLAAPFDSGVNFLAMFGLSGGMPTRVSLPRSRLPDVYEKLSIRRD